MSKSIYDDQKNPNQSPTLGFNSGTDIGGSEFVHTLERGLHKANKPNVTLGQGVTPPEIDQTPKAIRQPKAKIVGGRK